MKRNSLSCGCRQRGLTLVELVIALVVFSVGVMALLAAMARFGGSSADPLLAVQARAIAEAYLEEILSKSFTDPALDPLTGAACPAPNAGGRSVYDNICDYRGLPDQLVRDQSGTLIAGLDDYRVAVTVADNVAFQGVPAGQVLQVDVTVTDALGRIHTLTGVETRY
ncbi:MAG: prepilin-type cleavage/methylation protein [Moraxellaceae bacterium]|jgi:MSHA pilin protein MshD|nr:prepilin-type cleavage/methylation protein [Moraxellaceae bacterium]